MILEALKSIWNKTAVEENKNKTCFLFSELEVENLQASWLSRSPASLVKSLQDLELADSEGHINQIPHATQDCKQL